MGSAVGKQKELRDKVRSSQADTAGFFKDMQERRDVEWRERPDAETVVGECTSPEWEQPDSIVFSKPTDFAKKQQRQGRFFSKLYRFIGTWKLDQNCLFLRWDGKDGAMDVLRADRLEMEYTNPQTKMCVKISEPTVLPFWFTPDCVSKRFERSDESLKNFECGVCYFELWKSRYGAR
mmetsp:Transcript_25539/g.64377  ORF Transcript_25539/g.64377 Transcript_25539/m.64377 type:complete len:178 (+) Transcript_25539:623-1156(+)